VVKYLPTVVYIKNRIISINRGKWVAVTKTHREV
jgi:hypothetical protein